MNPFQFLRGAAFLITSVNYSSYNKSKMENKLGSHHKYIHYLKSNLIQIPNFNSCQEILIEYW